MPAPSDGPWGPAMAGYARRNPDTLRFLQEFFETDRLSGLACLARRPGVGPQRGGGAPEVEFLTAAGITTAPCLTSRERDPAKPLPDRHLRLPSEEMWP